jgi:plastocyanin
MNHRCGISSVKPDGVPCGEPRFTVIDRSSDSELESMVAMTSQFESPDNPRSSRRVAFLAILSFLWIAVPVTGADLPGDLPLEPSPDGVIHAEVVVDSYSFKPDHLIVLSGHPVELTLKSVTFIVPHNFIIKAPEMNVVVNQEVPAGDTVTVQFTPTTAGRAEFYCDKKLLFFKSHREKGMVGTLEVREGPEN